MKIAFVAKGGSGKSTTTALFLQYLEKTKKEYLCVDADSNIHMMDILGTTIDRTKGISYRDNDHDIKVYIKGNNSNIGSASQIVKTTPPSNDSHFLYIVKDNPLIKRYAVPVRKYGYLMHVGTYEEEGIGESCYHTNLSVFEALISHTITDERHLLVADMTAGTDAFAGALHAQFDLVCLVVEPTKESVALAKDYLYLANKGNVMRFVGIIANKIENGDDTTYIAHALAQPILASIPFIPDLKAIRRNGGSVFDLPEEVTNGISFDAVYEKAKTRIIWQICRDFME